MSLEPPSHTVVVKQEVCWEEEQEQRACQEVTVFIKREPEEPEQAEDASNKREPEAESGNNVGPVCVKTEVEEAAPETGERPEPPSLKIAPGECGLLWPVYATFEVPVTSYAVPVSKQEPSAKAGAKAPSKRRPPRPKDIQAELYECHDCGKRYTKKDSLRSHLRNHPGAPSRCGVCGKLVIGLRQHMAIHTIREYPCPVCQKNFKRKESLRIHVKSHEGERPFGCDHCSLRFLTKINAKRHEVVHNADRPYECDVCRKRFKHSNNLTDHRKLHSDKRFQCDICHRQFAMKAYLTDHMRVHTGEKGYACDLCDKKCRSRTNLNRHRRTHVGVARKLHECAECKATFTTAFSLRSHRLVHTGERPHECDICGKRFALKSNLKEHRKLHTGQPKYKCKVCKEQFEIRGYLRVHMLSHGAPPRYSCATCGRGFDKPSALAEHARAHGGTREFRCKCGADYVHAASLWRHRRTCDEAGSDPDEEPRRTGAAGEGSETDDKKIVATDVGSDERGASENTDAV